MSETSASATATSDDSKEDRESVFSQSKKHDFNLEVVSAHFKKCLQDDGRLILKEYMSAYYELCRFFRLTGRLFGFVAKDLEGKLSDIEFHINSREGHHYDTIDSMIQHEVNRKTTHKKSPHPSGCRMLLRLHWALEFILHFMGELRDSPEHAKTSKIAWKVYSQTLYHHHPKLTRKLASVAVHVLPSKKNLIEKMCKHDYGRVMDLLSEVNEVGQPIYDRVHVLLGDANLLAIP